MSVVRGVPLVILLALGVGVAPASAQTSPDPPARRLMAAPPPELGLRAYGFYDSVALAASETFDGAFGTSRASGFGAGVDLTDVWQRVFVRLAFSRASLEDGSRAFVIDDVVIPTGVRTDVRLRPLEIGAGWRQPVAAAGRYVAYGGAALLRLAYEQTSEFALPGEDVDETFSGYGIFAGVEALVWRPFFVGAELEYRAVPDALGADGLAAALGEDDLGGTAFRVIVGVRR